MLLPKRTASSSMLLPTRRPAAASDQWKRGRLNSSCGPAQLLFGRMWEDSQLELESFPRGAHVFAIASAGCTAMALAGSGHHVTAVDINPAQVDYARARFDGNPVRAGRVDRAMAWGRALLGWTGFSASELSAFLSLDNPVDQAALWRARMAHGTWSTAVRWLLNPFFLRAVYSSGFIQVLPRRFGSVVLQRLERGFALHPNRTNSFAWRILMGHEAPGPPVVDRTLTSVHRNIEFVCADAAEYLETCSPGSFGAFTLSNILDGAPSAYASRLMAAVRHAAQPDAVMVLRSFAEPRTPKEAALAACDRSLIWGCIHRVLVADI